MAFVNFENARPLSPYGRGWRGWLRRLLRRPAPQRCYLCAAPIERNR